MKSNSILAIFLVIAMISCVFVGESMANKGGEDIM